VSEPIKAHEIADLGAVRSDDGKFGLMQFKRARPASNGDTALWMAVPIHLMPYLATLCFRMIPQAGTGFKEKDVPAAFDAKVVEIAANAVGQFVLTVELEQDAAISYELDRGQAEALLVGLQIALGKGDFGPPAGMKAN
jgi:hypothetical protein